MQLLYLVTTVQKGRISTFVQVITLTEQSLELPLSKRMQRIKLQLKQLLRIQISQTNLSFLHITLIYPNTLDI